MSTALPDRSKSVMIEEDISSGDDTSETTKLFQDRLAAWRKVVDSLTDYVHSTEKMQSTHAKEYEKVLKSVHSAITPQDGFSQNLGGVAEMIENIKANTQGISNGHSETARTLKGTVLPIFERLDNEIKQRQKELKKGVGKGSKAVDKARAATQKHVELLGQTAPGVESGTAGRLDPDKDPFVVHKGIMYRLNKQLSEENSTRQEILAVQESFSQFESHIITTIQQGIGQFYTAMATQSDSQKHMYSTMAQTIQKVNPLFEWNAFIKRNNQLLIDPSGPSRSLSNISFPNQNHSTTQALCQGALERKQGLLKKYEASVYAITPAGFLHEFKHDDDLSRDPSPETSLYLPDCTVGGINGNVFSVKGKDHSSKLSLSGSKDYEFRARTDQDAETWWRIIREVSSGTAGAGAISPRVADAQSPNQSLRNNRVSSYGSQTPTSATQEKPGYELVGGEGGQTGKVLFNEEEAAAAAAAAAQGEKRL